MIKKLNNPTDTTTLIKTINQLIDIVNINELKCSKSKIEVLNNKKERRN